MAVCRTAWRNHKTKPTNRSPHPYRSLTLLISAKLVSHRRLLGVIDYKHLEGRFLRLQRQTELFADCGEYVRA